MARRVAAWLLHGVALAAGVPGAGLLIIAAWADDAAARLSEPERQP
jgi:hypothetical protein